MYNTAEIATLIRKKIEGSITDKELIKLQELADRHGPISRLLEIVENESMLLEDAAIYLRLSLEEEREARRHRLISNTLSKIHRKPKVSLFRRILPYVAALFVLSITGLWYYKLEKNKDTVTILQDLDPGSNRASITLSDGKVLELSGEHAGVVVGQDLTYADGALITNLAHEQVYYADLRTPRGGQYQITLVDGTQVWLNADSRLRYPSRFDGDQRIVELEGEGYFKVAKYEENGINKPFIVKTGNQLVHVLGTEFNVKGYPDEPLVETTLVEGVVRIREDHKELLIKPGEQVVNQGKELTKRKVDLAQELAWRKNEFSFYETELKNALQVLSRWYDFDIVNMELVPNTHLYGTISRNEGFAEVVKIMQTSGLKFRIERSTGRNKLIILQQK